MSKLICKVSRRKNDMSDIFEGTVQIAGARPTKLTKSKTDDTMFGTYNALAAAARSFSKRHGYTTVEFTGYTSTNGKKITTKSSKKVSNSVYQHASDLSSF